jgi:hypothetical protein
MARAVSDSNRRQEGLAANKVRHGVMSQAAVSVVSVTVMTDEGTQPEIDFYCPRCHIAVADPLVCGDCSAIICRRCGTPLERVDELGIG